MPDIKDKNRRYIVFIYDVIVIVASVFIAYLLRYDFSISPTSVMSLTGYLLLAFPVKAVVFYIFGLYKGMYRYTSIWDIVSIAKATLLSALIINTVFLVIPFFRVLPPSVLFLDFVFTFGLVALVRIAIRLYFSKSIITTTTSSKYHGKRTRLLLIGAGDTGEKIARDILSNSGDEYKIVGFLDDNIEKIGSSIHGIPIIDRIFTLNKLSIEFDEILITAPGASGDRLRRIIDECKISGKMFKTVPSLNELINKDVTLKSIREVSYLDLLGREEVQLDVDAIKNFIKGK